MLILEKLRTDFKNFSSGSLTPLSRGLLSAMYAEGIQGGLLIIKSNYIGILYK